MLPQERRHLGAAPPLSSATATAAGAGESAWYFQRLTDLRTSGPAPCAITPDAFAAVKVMNRLTPALTASYDGRTHPEDKILRLSCRCSPPKKKNRRGGDADTTGLSALRYKTLGGGVEGSKPPPPPPPPAAAAGVVAGRPASSGRLPLARVHLQSVSQGLCRRRLRQAGTRRAGGRATIPAGGEAAAAAAALCGRRKGGRVRRRRTTSAAAAATPAAPEESEDRQYARLSERYVRNLMERVQTRGRPGISRGVPSSWPVEHCLSEVMAWMDPEAAAAPAASCSVGSAAAAAAAVPPPPPAPPPLRGGALWSYDAGTWSPRVAAAAAAAAAGRSPLSPPPAGRRAGMLSPSVVARGLEGLLRRRTRLPEAATPLSPHGVSSSPPPPPPQQQQRCRYDASLHVPRAETALPPPTPAATVAQLRGREQRPLQALMTRRSPRRAAAAAAASPRRHTTVQEEEEGVEGEGEGGGQEVEEHEEEDEGEEEEVRGEVREAAPCEDAAAAAAARAAGGALLDTSDVSVGSSRDGGGLDEDFSEEEGEGVL